MIPPNLFPAYLPSMEQIDAYLAAIVEAAQRAADGLCTHAQATSAIEEARQRIFTAEQRAFIADPDCIDRFNELMAEMKRQARH